MMMFLFQCQTGLIFRFSGYLSPPSLLQHQQRSFDKFVAMCCGHAYITKVNKVSFAVQISLIVLPDSFLCLFSTISDHLVGGFSLDAAFCTVVMDEAEFPFALGAIAEMNGTSARPMCSMCQ